MSLQELKLQAGIQDNPDQEGLDLFAELIIQECAMFSMVITDDHYDVDALYRHFGVEK